MPRTRLACSPCGENHLSGTVYSAAFHEVFCLNRHLAGDAFRNCFTIEGLVLMSVFLELRRHSSFAEETVAQRHARFEGNLSEVIPTQETAGSGAITAESDEESLRPRSKLRRRWRLQATTAPITPPLFEDSPGSAGTRLSSWQLVHVDDLEVGGLALDAESSVLPAAPLAFAIAFLASATQLNCGLSPRDHHGKHLRCVCVTTPPFSWVEVEWYPSIRCPGNLQSSVSRLVCRRRPPTSTVYFAALHRPSPCPALPPPRTTQLTPSFHVRVWWSRCFGRPSLCRFSLLQLCMVTARRSHQSDGFQSSTSLHAEATARNQTMFEDLCQAHGHLSSALQEIAQSSHAPELR